MKNELKLDMDSLNPQNMNGISLLKTLWLLLSSRPLRLIATQATRLRYRWSDITKYYHRHQTRLPGCFISGQWVEHMKKLSCNLDLIFVQFEYFFVF